MVVTDSEDGCGDHGMLTPMLIVVIGDEKGYNDGDYEEWEPLEPGLKLAVTLRHLATGVNYADLMYSFRVARNSISLFVPEVCEAIISAYKEAVMPDNIPEEDWLRISAEFEKVWNLPHACGALDGKHIRIKKPADSGSLFYNYKNLFSMVMMAVVDADYKFIWLSVGSYGSSSDGQIFNNSELRPMLEEGTLGLPPPSPLPHDDRDTPYFLIGDDAFPLRPWMVKPYSRRHLDHDERIFNYRLFPARRVVENAFGILAMRFQILLGTMQQVPETVDSIVLACTTLHNLLRIRQPAALRQYVDEEDNSHNLVPGQWRQGTELADGEACYQRNVANAAGTAQRNYLKEYLNSEAGAVEWQENMI
ncbi:protein ALP1-like [Gigantopelta aegis]|uniref:protein ALP1-like n=1 Tax=Gigantopelta aegis TaxID=1735272 RepID=UPI001B88BE7B|nr:protein ALP1-like [Gigantopelta aegis]